MDRFLFQLNVEFPNKEKELYEIVTMTTGTEQKQSTKSLRSGEELLELREIAQQVPVAKAVADYAMDLVLHSHPEQPPCTRTSQKYVRYGSSPRGVLTGNYYHSKEYMLF